MKHRFNSTSCCQHRQLQTCARRNGLLRVASTSVDAIKRAGAYTLMELMVVISIIVLMIAIGVPSFTSLIRSSEASLAVNKLASGLSAARDVAVAAGVGNDGAAVFFFEPGGRVSIVPCVRIGELDDLDNSGAVIKRDVFIPAPEMEAIQLPRGWSVRAFTPINSIDSPTNPNGWYAGGDYPPDQSNWIFPETEFYNSNVQNDGADRQTFIIRFDGGTGTVSVSRPNTALVVSVRPSRQNRNAIASLRADRATDLKRWTRRVLNDGILTDAQKRNLIGDESGDTVLARPVTELCLYDEQKMAAILNLTLDRVTESLYQDLQIPRHLTGVNVNEINERIQGLDSGGNPIDPVGRVFTIERFSADLQELIREL